MGENTKTTLNCVFLCVKMVRFCHIYMTLLKVSLHYARTLVKSA